MSDFVRPHRQQPTRLLHPWDSPSKNTGVGCHFLLQCMKVKSESEVTQSCPTFSNPMDCSLCHYLTLFFQTMIYPASWPLHMLLLQSKTLFPCPQPQISIYLFSLILDSFPDSSVGKESTCNAGDPNSIPGLGRSPGEGNSYPLQYSGLENSMDRIVHGVTKSQTQLSDFHVYRFL